MVGVGGRSATIVMSVKLCERIVSRVTYPVVIVERHAQLT